MRWLQGVMWRVAGSRPTFVVTRYETYAFCVPASSFCGLPTNVSRRPSLNSSAIVPLGRASGVPGSAGVSAAMSDQPSECSEIVSVQLSAELAASIVKLDVGGAEAAAGDVWIAGLELLTLAAGRLTKIDSYQGASPSSAAKSR